MDKNGRIRLVAEAKHSDCEDIADGGLRSRYLQVALCLECSQHLEVERLRSSFAQKGGSPAGPQYPSSGANLARTSWIASSGQRPIFPHVALPIDALYMVGQNCTRCAITCGNSHFERYPFT